ncbi:uncharacterized protein RCC_08346 [Ramularia collo-cygni]|uniref:Uncharacterized protein n=1 Tax=Ramularia collo-cygni TaxID=112498 RepID=A0A2D3VF04_9PEZI|nr:uncharacterized protein RCC_08346 [Ramularia collo-cygni]CZT22641.1 uncharacterized protein RCC_08346 [Ramularia collo-cygni]
MPEGQKRHGGKGREKVLLQRQRPMEKDREMQGLGETGTRRYDARRAEDDGTAEEEEEDVTEGVEEEEEQEEEDDEEEQEEDEEEEEVIAHQTPNTPTPARKVKQPALQQQQQPPPIITHNLVLPRRLLHKPPPADRHVEQQPSPTSHPQQRSLFPRSHLRSRSDGTVLFSNSPSASAAPPMARTRSADYLTPQHAAQQTHPAGLRTPPTRQRSPFGEEHPRPRSPRSWEGSGIPSIQEDVALNIPLSRPLIPLARSSSGSLRRSRPASPLHSVTNAVSTPSTNNYAGSINYAGSHTGSANYAGSADGSERGSPQLGPIQRYYSNEAYPSATSSSASLSSTPTSWMSRSRSPSISSLETIEDAGEEIEMKEAEEVEKLREAAAADAEGSRRSSFDGGGAGRLRGVLGRERKRWSVCGGERRADLDLETIWED